MNRLFTVALTFVLVLGGFTGSYAGNATRIQYQGLISLNKVLWDISGATGIQFQLPESMTDVKTYVHVDADNWKSAVGQLLEEFSTMEIWTTDLHTSKVWILRNKFGGSVGTRTATTTIKQAVQRQALSVRASVIPARPIYQNASQGAAVHNDPLDMLPPHVRHDPEVLRYLHANGVTLPEDVREKYGDRLENLPPRRPMFPHVRKNPMFVRYLKSLGLQPPQA